MMGCDGDVVGGRWAMIWTGLSKMKSAVSCDIMVVCASGVWWTVPIQWVVGVVGVCLCSW